MTAAGVMTHKVQMTCVAQTEEIRYERQFRTHHHRLFLQLVHLYCGRSGRHIASLVSTEYKNHPGHVQWNGGPQVCH